MIRGGMVLVLAMAVVMASEAPPRAALGTNLAGVAYWSGAWSSVDLVRMAGAWQVVQHDDTAMALDIDARRTADGIPCDLPKEARAFRLFLPGGNEAVTLRASREFRELPTGTYTFQARGHGTLVIRGGGFPTTTIECRGDTRQALERTAGEHTGEGTWTVLEITATTATDPVRDLHLIMPGHEQTWETQPFPQPFLEDCRRFTTLRLMDWCAVNQSPVVRWQDRHPVAWYSWATPSRVLPIPPGGTRPHAGAVPYEQMITLAEQTGCAVWICIPPLADDDYVRAMARFFHERYPRDRELVVEWANETFNRAFLAWKISARAAGSQERSVVSRWQAERQRRIWSIWLEVWGCDPRQNASDDPRRPLRLAVGSHTLPELAEFPREPRADYAIDHFYWGLGFPRRVVAQGWTDRDASFLAAQVRTEVEATRQDLRERRERIAAFSSTHYPLAAVCYEGGAHYQDMWWDAAVNRQLPPALKTLDTLPSVQQEYQAMFRLLEEEGYTHLNCLFQMDGAHWGLRRSPLTPDAESPKMRACLDYLAGQR